MEESIQREATYFKYCGEVNTEEVLRAVRSRCEDSDLSKIVIASETGRSAMRAFDIFNGTGIRMIVVTHYPASTWGPKGKIPIGLKHACILTVLLYTSRTEMKNGRVISHWPTGPKEFYLKAGFAVLKSMENPKESILIYREGAK